LSFTVRGPTRIPAGELREAELTWYSVDSIVGRITGVTRRQEAGFSIEIYSFRLQEFDDNGHESREHQAVLRGKRVNGSPPHVGDWVEVEPRYKRGALQPNKIRNLVTGDAIWVPLGWRLHWA
jgi:hypothetical protein